MLGRPRSLSRSKTSIPASGTGRSRLSHASRILSVAFSSSEATDTKRLTVKPLYMPWTATAGQIVSFTAIKDAGRVTRVRKGDRCLLN